MAVCNMQVGFSKFGNMTVNIAEVGIVEVGIET
jgi:hypothetical protein